MKKIIKRIIRYLKIPFILSDYFKFKGSFGGERFPIKFHDFNPQIFDKLSTFKFDSHYLYHPAWAARVISKTKPKEHVDISSILHFGAIISAFVPVKFYDYRPATVVPVGKPKIEYNAHRIYSYEQVVDSFSGLTLKEFCLIPENSDGVIKYNDAASVSQENYACGCFWFEKP